MAERHTLSNQNRNKIQQRLSVTKKRGGRGTRESSRASRGSITAFFNNAPPCKLACPLCGELVPRFKINEHIDSQCQKFLRENDDEVALVSSHKQENPVLSKSPPRDDKRVPDQETGSNSNEKKQEANTSPYFKKQCVLQRESCETSSQAKVVRTIDLGSLSSKLSRKVLKFPEGSMVQHTQKSPREEGNNGETNSSQKENNCSENSRAKNGCLATDSALSCSTHSKQTSPVDQPQVEKLEKSDRGESKPEPPLGVASLSVTSAAPSKLMKRRKAETPQGSVTTLTPKASKLSKRGRYEDGSSKPENSVPVISQRQSGTGNTHQPEDSSSVCCAQPLSHVKTESTFTEDIEQSTTTAPGDGPTVPNTDVANEVPRTLGLPRRPYYLQNFLTVLEAVLENEDDRILFNQEDLSDIHTFQQLSAPGQMLYVRLFQRKLKWLQVNKVDYAEISSDLKPVVQELVDGGFLQTERELQEIGEVLDLLPAPELKSLAKTFHLGGPGIGTQKQQLVEGLLRLGKQRSLFALAPGQNNTGAVILKRAKQLAGSCVRVCRRPRAVFSRLLLLFSLTDTLEEEDMAAGGHGQLYTILLVNSGRLAFPAYTVQRRARVFQDRDDLIRYEAAMQTLQEVVMAMQTGSWEDALGLYTAAKATWQELRDTCDLCQQEELPVFLRCFTVGWTYTRILSRGVEILQRLRRYEEAVEELRSLLTQSAYCAVSRGRWWDRLALNLQQHLKLHEQAIAAIRDGLLDPLVRTGHRLSLHQRAARMRESSSFKKYRLLLQGLPSVHVQDVSHVTIRGQLFPHAGGMGKSVFLRAADEGAGEGGDATVMCSVEELALAHYRMLGFDQGIHGEGSTFSTLFGLLMWDIIFMEGLPDVFRNLYQTCPLDLHTDCFYGNRAEAIEARAEVLREASAETLQDLLAEVWRSQQGRVCVLVNWDRFSSLQQAQSLMCCLGGLFLSGVVLKMAKDYRHCRGGLPDLVVWNTTSNTYKLVEVKGPNDRLSQKQQIWLDELRKMGADVEVCHVTATGARGARLEKDL